VCVSVGVDFSKGGSTVKKKSTAFEEQVANESIRTYNNGTVTYVAFT